MVLSRKSTFHLQAFSLKVESRNSRKRLLLPFLLLLLFLPSYLPRSARAGIFKCGDYIRVTSRSANGCHGCELRLNATLPFGKYYGRAVRITKGDVVVVASEPRLSIASVTRRVASFLCVVGHAPHATAAELPDVWWTSFRARVQPFCGSRQSNYVFLWMQTFNRATLRMMW